MIDNLRKKFVLVAMCSTFGVLAVIMGGVNVINYCRMTERADEMLLLLSENGGKFTEHHPGDWKDKPVDFRPKDLSPEAPFETRYFSVTMNQEGETLSSDTGNIAAVGQQDAAAYAKEIFESKASKGFKDVYRYYKKDNGTESLIIFLDCRHEISSIQTLAISTGSISIVGLLAVFILVLFFSKMVFKPVAESYEKQKQFITDASHEIKTPLTIIDANTQVLEMENGESQWSISTRNQVKRLTSLTQQLIILSRLDEAEESQEKQEFVLSDAVAESVEPFEALARTQEKVLDVKIEENIKFFGNEKSIRQMVGILMDNAVKYSSFHGRIMINLKRKGKRIQMQVFNTTEDMPKGSLDILFERFYRMDTSRNSQTGGSGIGLSVAKAIVLSHKGKISAYSEDGKSLTVTVVL